MIIYEIAGVPIPWAVPRLGKHAVYNPKALQKEQTIWQLKPQVNHPAISGPVCLDVTFYMPIPKSTSAIRKRQMLNGLIYPIGKPDRTNLLKFIEDCLEEAGVFSNDSIIVAGEPRKVYGQTPKTLIKITQLNQLNERHCEGNY